MILQDKFIYIYISTHCFAQKSMVFCANVKYKTINTKNTYC